MERTGPEQTRAKTNNRTKYTGENKQDRANVNPEAPSSEKPPSADDKPDQHGITDELVQTFLRRFLPEDSQFVVTDYKYRPVANFGEGFTTVRKVLEVTYCDETSGKEKMAVFVVKIPGGSYAAILRGMGMYEREVIMYSQVVELFRYIPSQRGQKVPLPFPRFVYGTMVLKGEVRDAQDQLTTDQTPREKLVIELLDGFQVIDKKTGLDLDHLRLVMPAVARFHAVGCVLRKRHSERADRLRQVRSRMPDGVAKMSVVLSPSCAALEHAGLTSEAATIARLIAEGHYMAGHSSTFTEDREAVTLLHGDLWSSNMMFKYRTDEDGVTHPEELRFVDLQLCQFGDPAYDLVYCLLTSTRRETRRDHLRQLLTWYEAAFRAQLEELGEDADQLTPWLSVENLYRMYGSALYNNFCAPMPVVQHMFARSEDKAEMLARSSSDRLAGYRRVAARWREGRCAPELTERLVGIVEDLREFGYL